MLKYFFSCLLVIGFIGMSHAATYYYIDKDSIGGACSDRNAGTSIGAPWCTITKANSTLVAGDTVYIRGGIYSNYINPSNSGTSGSRITYRNYGTETVTISGTSYAVYLNGRSYVTVQGINASGCNQNMYILGGSTYNIIAYCNFTLSSPTVWNGSRIYGSSQYNWIHHSTFSKAGQCANGSDDGSVLDIGSEDAYDDYSWYNLIEDSTFYHGGHHVVEICSRYNTFRNNYLHNEVWTNGKGNRTFMTVGRDAATGYNIIEGNRFGYAAPPCDDVYVAQMNISSSYNLFRYNKSYHANGAGTTFYYYSGWSAGAYNRFYNNTYFNNADDLIDPSEKGGSRDAAVSFLTSSVKGNILKNNLYYSHRTPYAAGDGASLGNQIFANEFNGDSQGNPLFVNASTTPPADKTDATLPNLDLQSNSPAINQGGPLTTVAVADTGSGTSLILTDSRYFQDGTYAPSGTVQADWIAVGTVGNVVQVSSINYSTNTITLANSISRSNADPVWLYKKSDGVQVLYGSAPDAGAYEHEQAQAPSAPKNLRVIK